MAGHSLRIAVAVCIALALSHAYDLEDPKADHTSYAIEISEAGDMAAAIASFAAAAKFAPRAP